MSITIKVNNQEWNWTKSEIRTLSPVINTILELDPSCDTIELTHPSVTMQIMNLIDTIIKIQSIPIDLPTDQLESGGKYLQIEMFIALSDPNYINIKRCYPWFNILDISQIPSELYKSIVKWNPPCLKLVKYLFDMTDTTKYSETDTDIFRILTYSKEWVNTHEYIIKLLFKRDLRLTCYLSWRAVESFTYSLNPDLLQQLISYPGFYIDTFWSLSDPVIWASDHKQLDIVKNIILARHDPLELAVYKGDLEYITNHIHTVQSLFNGMIDGLIHLIVLACYMDKLNIAKFILGNTPHITTDNISNMLLKFKDNPKVKEIFTSHELFKQENYNYHEWISDRSIIPISYQFPKGVGLYC